MDIETEAEHALRICRTYGAAALSIMVGRDQTARVIAGLLNVSMNDETMTRALALAHMSGVYVTEADAVKRILSKIQPGKPYTEPAIEYVLHCPFATSLIDRYMTPVRRLFGLSPSSWAATPCCLSAELTMRLYTYLIFGVASSRIDEAIYLWRLVESAVDRSPAEALAPILNVVYAVNERFPRVFISRLLAAKLAARVLDVPADSRSMLAALLLRCIRTGYGQLLCTPTVARFMVSIPLLARELQVVVNSTPEMLSFWALAQP